MQKQKSLTLLIQKGICPSLSGIFQLEYAGGKQGDVSNSTNFRL